MAAADTHGDAARHACQGEPQLKPGCHSRLSLPPEKRARLPHCVGSTSFKPPPTLSCEATRYGAGTARVAGSETPPWLPVVQVVDNFIAGKSEGVSVFFIMIWLIGDSFNIVGCLLAHAVRHCPAHPPCLSTTTTRPSPTLHTHMPCAHTSCWTLR
jgi:hypothetical protein